MSYRSFTDLEVYKKCRSFRKWVSKITKDFFPKDEKYLLNAQILDSSRSVTANIAEGYGRYYYQDNLRFCRIARGSLEETLDHLIVAFDEKYISSELLKEGKVKQEECLRLLNGYIRHIRTSKKGNESKESKE